LNIFSATDLLILIIVLVGLIIMSIYIPRLLILNAMKKVIKTMINNDAITPQNAQTAEQLGIKQGYRWENMLRMRDYRPQALHMLVETELVVNTMDDRYYLSQQKLKASRFRDLYYDND
jgi:hypothetical protein